MMADTRTAPLTDPAPGTNTAPDAPRPFDLLGELPRGTVVLEASAGTGKTYAIAALATRYVAEAGIPLSELLLVTFTRAATAELRDRVRRRLIEAADHLAAAMAGGPTTSGDPLLTHLADVPAAEQRRRHRRLGDALLEFDTATISTIHGFCQQVLRGIGLAADVPRRPAFVEDEALLREQVVKDRMVARFVDRAGAPALKSVLAAANAAVDDPRAMLLPSEPALPDDVAGEDPDATARLIAELAREVRAELARRKRSEDVLSYQDLLTRLCDAVCHPEHGDAAVAVLRDRYRVALIDEFQDTDPVQWEILERAFDAAGTGRALVLIGDPKQAIYAFRGADVRAYLRATHQAERFTLGTNWRSDAPLVDCLNRLFEGTVFGHPEIAYRQVTASAAHARPRLEGPPELAGPLAIRVVGEEGAGVAAGVARRRIPVDVAAEVVRMLGCADLSLGGEPPRPRDIAVLVRSNQDAARIQEALQRVRVPAVINGVGSVFATAAATDWLRLLEALQRPNAPGAARLLAVSAFGGWDAERLAEDDEAGWGDLHARLHDWARLLTERGVASLLRAVATGTGLSARLLAVLGGERRLTDLLHVGELLHAAQLDMDLGPSALLVWLRERIVESEGVTVPPDEQARRLESDAEAVQILTIHRSKGLEFGIVLCPYLWSEGQALQAPLVLADPASDRRFIDVGPSNRTGFADSKAAANQEREGEDLRLLYVAATRARHRLVLWWVPPTNGSRCALGAVLFGRDVDGQVLPERPRTPGGAGADLLAFEQRAAAWGATVARAIPGQTPSPYEPPSTSGRTLRIEPLQRRIDRAWRRTSFSGLVHHTPHPGDPLDERDGAATKDDEGTDGMPAGQPRDDRADDGRSLRAIELPLAEVRGSAELGTMLHAVLEHADLAAPDLESELAHHLDRQQARSPIEAGHRDRLLAGLVAAVRTPLGPLTGGRPLASFVRADRLDEARFELPLAGGAQDPRRTPVSLPRLADLLEKHLSDTDPLRDYPERLRDPRFTGDLRGYLTGAIDLILRVREDGRPDRYVVVDHKTNRLGWPDTPTAWHYRPSGLAAAMQDGHYPLQALFYAVALHRLLRWRIADHDPERDLGGIAYLFLRGMTGPEVPLVGGQPCGIFSWRPPGALVTDLSDLLDGRMGEQRA